MMKKIFLAVILIGFSPILFAQEIKDWTFGINMGASVPTGDLQKSSIGDDPAGFAERGFYLNFTGNYRINRSWSLVGMFYYNHNTLDEASMQAYYEDGLRDVIDREDPDYFDASDSGLSTLTNTFASDDWMGNAVLVGGKYTYPVKRMILEAQALAGLQYTFLPKFTQRLIASSEATQWAYDSAKDQDVSFAFAGGVAVHFPITQRARLRVSVDYFYTQVEVETRIAELNVGDNEVADYLDTNTYNINYSTLNAGLGLIYNF